MSRTEAERAAKQLMMSGYKHHSFEDERETYDLMFQTERDEFTKQLHTNHLDSLLSHYAEVMAPTHMRGMKNALISLITSVCRKAIDEGLNVEFSFALSDYYVCKLEEIGTEKKLLSFMREVLLHYFDLVQNEQRHFYSKSISSAVRYIGRNLYSICTVKDVADYVELNPRYFSTLFAKQVGLPPSKYILKRKLEEAKRVLIHQNTGITEIAEALSFSDVSHFSRSFKTHFKISPSQLLRQDAPRRPGK